MFKYSARIDEQEFFNAANQELQKLVSSSISYAINKTRSLFIQEIKKSLIEDSFYLSLTDYDNVLFFQIGLPNVGSVADTIVDYVSKAFSLRKLPAKKNDFGGFSIVVLKEGIQPLISLPFAGYTSKRGDVDWLQWLLTAGTSEVVANYRIMYGDFRSSRTKEAIMVPSKSGGFRFDAEFAGTEDNNWITRSLSRLESRLKAIFENIINNYIQK